MIEIPCQQGSAEWQELRRGVPTASNFGRIMTPARRQYSATARKYALELVADMIDPTPPWLSPSGISHTAAIQNGIDTEPEARRWYALEKDVDVRQVGFCLTDDRRFGCSPDGLVGADGGLELKCPLLRTHILYLDAGTLPEEYAAQVHGSLIVTGREWWDFMSYAPPLPALLIRVYRDDFTEALRGHLETFWDEYAAVRAKFGFPVGTADLDEPAGSMSDWRESGKRAER